LAFENVFTTLAFANLLVGVENPADKDVPPVNKCFSGSQRNKPNCVLFLISLRRNFGPKRELIFQTFDRTLLLFSSI
jgi:hypothetical protein